MDDLKITRLGWYYDTTGLEPGLVPFKTGPTSIRSTIRLGMSSLMQQTLPETAPYYYAVQEIIGFRFQGRCNHGGSILQTETMGKLLAVYDS